MSVLVRDRSDHPQHTSYSVLTLFQLDGNIHNRQLFAESPRLTAERPWSNIDSAGITEDHLTSPADTRHYFHHPVTTSGRRGEAWLDHQTLFPFLLDVTMGAGAPCQDHEAQYWQIFIIAPATSAKLYLQIMTYLQRANNFAEDLVAQKCPDLNLPQPSEIGIQQQQHGNCCVKGKNLCRLRLMYVDLLFTSSNLHAGLQRISSWRLLWLKIT